MTKPRIHPDTPVEYFGHDYQSIRELADAYAVPLEQARRNIDAGYPVDAFALCHGSPCPVVVAGVRYPSVAVAARREGVGVATLHSAIRNYKVGGLWRISFPNRRTPKPRALWLLIRDTARVADVDC